MLTTLFFSQGVPMLLAGDELYRTQNGQQQRVLPGQRDQLGRLGRAQGRRLAAAVRARTRGLAPRASGVAPRHLPQGRAAGQPLARHLVVASRGPRDRGPGMERPGTARSRRRIRRHRVGTRPACCCSIPRKRECEFRLPRDQSQVAGKWCSTPRIPSGMLSGSRLPAGPVKVGALPDSGAATCPSDRRLTPLIERLARARGIGDAYHSYKGELKQFSLATKAAILRAMHCRLDDAAALEAQIRESEAAHPSGLFGDVVVLRERCARRACEHARDRTERLVAMAVVLEDGGGAQRRSARLGSAGARLASAGRSMVRAARSALPGDLPLGYHRLEVELEFARNGRLRADRRAGRKCYEPAESKWRRSSGASPCSSTRCARRTTGASAISPTCAELCGSRPASGAGFVGISPVHALFSVGPRLYSPYSASSRHALNVMFIDVAAVLEVQGSRRAQALMADAGFRARLAKARAATHVDYPAVASAQARRCCEAAFEPFAREHLARATRRAPPHAASSCANAASRCGCTRCSTRSIRHLGGITARARVGTTGRRNTRTPSARPCAVRASMPMTSTSTATCNGSPPSNWVR